MQRRAAGGYAAFFLVITVAAVAALATGQTFDNDSALTAIAVLSGLTVFLLLSISYLPVRR